LFDEIAPEFGLFYEMVQIKHEKMIQWDEIIKLTEELTTLQRRKGPRAALNRILSRRLITNAYISLAQYEANSVFSKAGFQEDYSGHYQGPIQPYIKRYVDEELARDFIPPMDATMRIVELADKRQAHRINIFVLLISSLLGGAIGSLLTLALSN
jgi:hypothetical protein